MSVNINSGQVRIDTPVLPSPALLCPREQPNRLCPSFGFSSEFAALLLAAIAHICLNQAQPFAQRSAAPHTCLTCRKLIFKYAHINYNRNFSSLRLSLSHSLPAQLSLLINAATSSDRLMRAAANLSSRRVAILLSARYGH